MKRWIFHGLNMIVLMGIAVIGLFALFGAGMSAGTYPGIHFAVFTTFVWWGIFYLIQYIKEKNAWRITWFIISLIFLWNWMGGGGASVWNWIG